MDDSTLQAIRNPGLLVKTDNGFLCSSGRTIYTIKSCDTTWLGDAWGVYAPNGKFMESFHWIEYARQYAFRSADFDTPELAERRRELNNRYSGVGMDDYYD